MPTDTEKLAEALKAIELLDAERNALRIHAENAKQEAEAQKARRKEAEQQAMQLSAENLRRESQQSSRVEEQTENTNENSEMRQLLTTMAKLLQQQNDTSNVTYSVVPDSQGSIRNFNSTEEPEYSRVWLKELINAKTVYLWTDAMAYSIAKNHLKGAAHKWFLARVDVIKDFETFREAFEATFMYKQSRAEKMNTMTQRVQTAKESTLEYFHDKVWLCRDLDLDVEETKIEIVAGVWSRDLSHYIMSRDYHNLDTLYQDIMRYEKMDAVRRERIGVKKPSTSSGSKENNGGNTKNSEYVKLNNNAVDIKSKEGRVEFKCFNCGSPEHGIKDCTAPRKELKCFNCNRLGHIAKKCDKPQRQRKQATEEIRIVEGTEVGTSVGKFLRNIRIGGVELKAQIDMGASVCTMKGSIVLREGFSMERDIMKLAGFGNNEVMSLGVVSEEITFENLKPRQLTFRIVPDDVQGHDVILGRPFTEALDVSYTRLGYELKFSQVDPSYFSNESIRAEKSYTKDNSELEPGTVKFINISWSGREIELPVCNYGETTESVKAREPLGESILAVENLPEIKKRNEIIKPEEVKVGETITKKQQEELVIVLNEFRDCIAKNTNELGCTNLLEMEILVKEGSKPVVSRPYKLNARDRADLDEIVNTGKTAGIITETKSPYASPAFIIRKKDGSPRMVVDYRKLNKDTVNIHFPMPNFDEFLGTLSQGAMFILLDLAQGYLQVPLSKDARDKTAFITEDQTGEFTRAMFGLVGAPIYFAKAMRMALQPAHQKKMAVTYFDDSCIIGKNWEELMNNLRYVLRLLREAGLTLNLRKCEFGKKRIEFLGFQIGEGKVETGSRKVAAINEFPLPKNVHDIRRFIGLASFFRRFIPDFAKIAAPLTTLTKKDQLFNWTNVENQAFQQLKELLTAKPTLQIYNPTAKRTELHTDASAKGIAGMLLQTDDAGTLRLVYAISKRTTEIEAQYHSSKLELMAIAWALGRLRAFLISLKFTIVTDCECLIHINAWKTNQPQIARWLSAIAEFDFEIIHRAGIKMQHVDALSRAPVDEATEEPEREGIFTIATREDEVLMFQRTSDKILQKIQILEKNDRDRSKAEKDETKEFKLIDGLLSRDSVESRAKYIK